MPNENVSKADVRVFFGGAEIVRRQDESEIIAGLAAVYYDAADPGTEYQLWWGRIFERIMPGAFDRVLGENPDVRGLVNHDPNQLLGRTTADTLRLSASERGLAYEIDPPDTGPGRDIVELLRRRDITGSSFAFTVQREEWETDKENDREIRKILEIDQLYDVGPVTYPAYESTEAALRSAQLGALASYEAWKQSQAARQQQEQRRARAWSLARAQAISRQRISN